MHKAKSLQLFSLHPMYQQESPCCHNFLRFTQSPHSKETPISKMQNENIAEAILLLVITIAFPASLFKVTFSLKTKRFQLKGEKCFVREPNFL